MLKAGESAPQVRVHDLDDRPVVLRGSHRGRALLLMFCTIGCVPCRQSEPLLAAAGEEFSDRLDVACVMLAEPAEVRAMLATQTDRPEVRFLADSAGEGLFPVANAFGVMGTPTTYLIGGDGRIRWRHVGRLTQEHLDRDIPALLEQDEPRAGVVLLGAQPIAD